MILDPRPSLVFFLQVKKAERGLGTRLNADIPYLKKHSVLLSRKHPLMSLIMKSAHEIVEQNEMKETLTEIRAKYWTVKSIIH